MKLIFSAWDHRLNQWAITDFGILGEVTAFNLIEKYFNENPINSEAGITDSQYISMLERLNEIEIVQYIRDTADGNSVYYKDVLYYPDYGYGTIKWDETDGSFYIDFGTEEVLMGLLEDKECVRIGTILDTNIFYPFK